MAWDIRQLTKTRTILGEGAHYSERDRRLYSVDIKGRKIFQTDPEAGHQVIWQTPAEIGFIVTDPNSDNFIGALRKGIARLILPLGEGEAQIEYICKPEDYLHQNRFNDGCIDRYGNIWAGTMDDEEQQSSGNWWHVSKTGQAKMLLSGFKVTNGPAFSPDGRTVYLTNSAQRTVYRAYYNAEAVLTDVHIWRIFGEDDGYPDGMCFCPRGLLWIAFWDGACLRAFDEAGNLVETLGLPVQRPTKPVFRTDGTGYVTSASSGLEASKADGCIFSFRRSA